MNYAVEISSLSKRYGKITALKNVSLNVPFGKIYGLLGPNGAGKTTLIKAIVGALRPSSGNVNILGLDPMNNKSELRKQIGYMPQSAALYEDLSARDNILFFGKAQDTKDVQKKVNEILSFTELTARANDAVHTFSGGMKKRVSLACVLIHEPKILFLDEPTAAVDPHLRMRSWALFRELASQGKTVFISTHLMEEALLCDHLAILTNGELLAVDTPQNILSRGKTKIIIDKNGETVHADVSSNSTDLAMALHGYGLSSEIKSVEVHPDSLEDIFLSMIKKENVE